MAGRLLDVTLIDCSLTSSPASHQRSSSSTRVDAMYDADIARFDPGAEAMARDLFDITQH
jgi:hypothetical protein